jgi:DNA-directed RNA polymerase specialized sigma24 family protein
MVLTVGLAAVSLTEIAQRCREESQRYFAQLTFDPQYCYELFRRALVDRLDEAWALLYTQYAPQITRWVERHPGFATSGEEAALFVNQALQKLWMALTPAKFANFPSLSALLSYLQLCVHSAVTDHLRAREQAAQLDPDAEQGPDPQDEVLSAEARSAFWQRIQERLKSEQEVHLLYYRFVLDLKPRQICERFPDEFPDVDVVYDLTQNILARLRRDPELRQFLG